MSRYIDPTTDFGFKKLFGEEANKDIIMSFITDVLELQTPLADLRFLDKEQLPEIIEKRAGVYDLFCTDQAGNHCIVEMQKSPIAYIKDRMVYYSTFPIAKQAPKGEMSRVAEPVATYGKPPQKAPWDFRLDAVYCIAILGYALDGSTTAVNRNSIRNDEPPHELFYDKLKFITIELPLFDESKPEYNLEKHLNKWLYFLNYLPSLNRIPELFKGDVVFEKAFNLAEIANLTPQELSMYHRSLKYEWDDYAKLTTAEEKGVKKVAKALLEEGSDPAFVAKVTGLSMDQIQKLQKPAATIRKLYLTKE
ncbi:Rpn family recombination-promoting nuclease/putative transposase [candidate division KSB1 bacterium]|nr:Rpn family recombination-promoting nuclease/putative transposase [candidate division KSB1 bacterium]